MSSVQPHYNVLIPRYVVADGAVELGECTDGLRTVHSCEAGEGGIHVATDGGVEGSSSAGCFSAVSVSILGAGSGVCAGVSRAGELVEAARSQTPQAVRQRALVVAV